MERATKHLEHHLTTNTPVPDTACGYCKGEK